MAIRLGSKSTEGDFGDGDIVAEINITPLTDIFLVLLIIFMVTSSVITSTGVDVNLPEASNSTAQSQSEGVIVTLLPGGEVRINGQTIPGALSGKLENFESALAQVFTQTKSRLVILQGDRQAFLGSAITVMDSARKAGADKFAIATAPEKN